MEKSENTMARYSEAHKNATLKYQKKVYDNLKFRMKKGFKEDILRPAAEHVGITMNEFMRVAIIEKAMRDGPPDLPIDQYFKQ